MVGLNWTLVSDSNRGDSRVAAYRVKSLHQLVMEVPVGFGPTLPDYETGVFPSKLRNHWSPINESNIDYLLTKEVYYRCTKRAKLMSFNHVAKSLPYCGKESEHDGTCCQL